MTPAETSTRVSYFFVLIILAVDGWHRYDLVYLNAEDPVVLNTQVASGK